MTTTIPSLGATVNEVHAAWRAASEKDHRIIGRDIGNGGTFDYRYNGEIWRVWHSFDRSRVPTCRKATPAEIDGIDDSIARGFFQIEHNRGGRWEQRETTVLHQSTGRPLA